MSNKNKILPNNDFIENIGHGGLQQGGQESLAAL